MANDTVIAGLLEKANSLPLTPGVYIMRDKNGKVIYVGKSRKLKNRVSQYFQNSRKNIKTSRMVENVYSFDYILCKTEIEALSLENTLIKQYAPKYNIRLKDAKTYPYIKLTAGDYPKLVVTRTRLADRGKYFGPFSGTGAAYAILNILHKTLGIPNCNRSFPRDIGRERPCIYYQMRQCCGVCTGRVTKEEYAALIRLCTEILRGNTAVASAGLQAQMMTYAEEENFEAAARCRDTLRALERLGQKQNVVASPDTNLDVFGMYTDEFSTCLSVMYVRNGAVSNKLDWSFRADAVADSSALTAFLADHYMGRDDIPKTVLTSFELEDSDRQTLEEYLSAGAHTKVTVRRPERGGWHTLCDTVCRNAEENAHQKLLEAQRDESVLLRLAGLLHLESVPERIEAYDISNIGAENITAGMVVYVNGKPQKSDYRSFRIRSVSGAPDDYKSMQEAIRRRLQHLKDDTSGSFAQYPDLLLIDGGRGHVSAVREVLREFGMELPVFGMVKDDFHKTRALCTEHEEINIAREKEIFMLMYRIQEEVHRFTVGKTTAAKRRTLKHSSLEKIPGVGAVKAKKLLAAFGTLAALREAPVEQIAAVSGIHETDAYQIYQYFHKEGDTAHDEDHNRES